MSATLTVSWWQHTRRIYLLSVIWSDLKHLPVKSGWRKCDLGFWFKLASTCPLNLSFLLVLQIRSHPSPWLPHDKLLQIHFSHHHIHLTLLSILPCYLLPPYYPGKIPRGCFVADVTAVELKMMMREMVPVFSPSLSTLRCTAYLEMFHSVHWDLQQSLQMPPLAFCSAAMMPLSHL